MLISTSKLPLSIVRKVLDREFASSAYRVILILTLHSSQEVNAIGPGIGPAAVPPPLASLPPPPASLPAPPQTSANSGAYSAATISSGPQPASMYSNQPPPIMLPPLHYQGMDAAQPFGYQPPAPGMHPSRMAALAAANGVLQSQAGVVRSADEMEGAADEIPPAKRQRVAKLPGGQLYPEADWISMHPVSTCQCRLCFHTLINIFSILSHFKSNFPMIYRSLIGSSMGLSSPFQIYPSIYWFQLCVIVFVNTLVVQSRRRGSGYHILGRC